MVPKRKKNIFKDSNDVDRIDDSVVVTFDFGNGTVIVIGWAQMLTALTTLLRPFVLPGKDVTAKLKRLWAYELTDREGGNRR